MSFTGDQYMGFICRTGRDTMCKREIPTGISAAPRCFSVMSTTAGGRFTLLADLDRPPSAAAERECPSGVSEKGAGVDEREASSVSTRTNGRPEMPSSTTGGLTCMVVFPRDPGKTASRDVDTVPDFVVLLGLDGRDISAGEVPALSEPAKTFLGIAVPPAEMPRDGGRSPPLEMTESVLALARVNWSITCWIICSWSRYCWRFRVTAQNSRLSSADASRGRSGQQTGMSASRASGCDSYIGTVNPAAFSPSPSCLSLCLAVSFWIIFASLSALSLDKDELGLVFCRDWTWFSWSLAEARDIQAFSSAMLSAAEKGLNEPFPSAAPVLAAADRGSSIGIGDE